MSTGSDAPEDDIEDHSERLIASFAVSAAGEPYIRFSRGEVPPLPAVLVCRHHELLLVFSMTSYAQTIHPWLWCLTSPQTSMGLSLPSPSHTTNIDRAKASMFYLKTHAA
jgi:hypothetical protein